VSMHQNRYGENGTRSRRYIVIGVALAGAAAMLIPLMNRTEASAATAQDVALNCRDGSPLLERCDFIQKTESLADGNSFRVSEVQSNCGGTEPDPFSLAATVTSDTEFQLGTGSFFNLSGSGALRDVFGGVAKSVQERFQITGFTEEKSDSIKISANVEPGERAAIYFRPKVVQAGGFLEATYKEAEDGTKVFFFPERNADNVLVRFPLIDENGKDPEGFYWVRRVKCQSAPSGAGDSPSSGFDTAGFGESTSFGVTDTPITVG
jgi:hypothetical protein